MVRLSGYGDDTPAQILFDLTTHNELVVNLEIRDEDLTETLKMRWRVESNSRPPGAPDKEYQCPEPEILGDGDLYRRAPLRLLATSFARGTCNRVDVIVSASFKTCRPDRDDGWDITTQDDDDADIGRLSFWVWAYNGPSGDPRLQPEAALALTMSCPSQDYQPPSATATETSAATGM